MFYRDKLNAIVLQLVDIGVSLVCLDTVFEGVLECVGWGVCLGFSGQGGRIFFLPSTNFLGLPFILNLPSERQFQDWDQ